MKIRFTKMHGLGNDFVVIDAISQRVKLDTQKILKIADRRFGIGCDQVLIVEAPGNPKVDFRYRIFNADGSEVENCGNGARCFARFVHDRRLTGKRNIIVETASGVMTLTLLDNKNVLVDMGAPVLDPDKLPFLASAQAPTYAINVADTELHISAVSMGNPHAVLLVDDIGSAPVGTLGPLIESHPQFPQRVNAGFMEIVSPAEINLRVYERGAGETLACGTGACAAVVAGRLQQRLEERVSVNLPGGTLDIQWQGEGHSVFMAGPVTSVFHGQINL